MKYQFPTSFFFGTSTAAAQIETASAHSWRGERSKDGHIFQETIEHEKRRDEDAAYIQKFGTVYRCGVDWARLQTEPFGLFDADVVAEYSVFFQKLNAQGMQIMLVLHHFTNPIWFEALGSWEKEENIAYFSNFAEQAIHHFSKYVAYWNTFNEPNVYVMNGWILGNFPPHVKNYFKANKVLKIIQKAHEITYNVLKNKDLNKPVGISLNTATFEAANVLGYIPAKFVHWWFNERSARHFELCDFWGLSYYAYMLFDPMPISQVDRPGKLAQMGIPHDNMWGYQPTGLLKILQYFYKTYQKPIIITENGICTESDSVRIQAIHDYLKVIQTAIEVHKIPVQGYIHWSTFDNFEWDLGPTYRFGLVRIDLKTKNRTMTAAGDYYEQVSKTKCIEFDSK
jgi:beta-glucosidase